MKNLWASLGAFLALSGWMGGPAWAQAASPAQPTHVHKHRPAMGTGVAFSPAGELWLVGVNEQARLFAQTSRNQGRTWEPPRELPIGSDTLSADGENRPKIAFGPRGLVVISYTQPLEKSHTGQIRLLRSVDGGRNFSPPVTVHKDRQLITHRFESIAFDARGVLHTLWIDKRDLEAVKSDDPEGYKQKYRGAAIYRNQSSDGGLTFGSDIKVADHSCECCRIALTPAPKGGVAAMWRHVFTPNERDHAFALLGGPSAGAAAAPAEPMRSSMDRWAIDGCPHHGPGLTRDRAGGYHAVWFGERNGEARVRYGRLRADGSPQGEPVALPDDKAEHADVQSVGRHVVVVWRSFNGEATVWRAWVSKDSGRSFALKELGLTREANDHPRLAVRGQRIVSVWRTQTGVQVETLTP